MKKIEIGDNLAIVLIVIIVNVILLMLAYLDKTNP